MQENFADRLMRVIEAQRSCLVVGIDPILERLPREVAAIVGSGAPGGSGFTARAAAAFGLFSTRVIDAVSGIAVAVKPNTAFFERLGAAGWDALLETCRAAKKAGLLVIADAKRGDIGHTAEAYADAFLGDTPDTLGPSVDALTVSPYMGTDSVRPFIDRAIAGGKGLFVLVRTSNPSAAEVQDLDAGGQPLYLRIAELVRRWGGEPSSADGLAPVGAVVGATAPAEARAIREALPRAFFLVPGYGAQGGSLDGLRACFLPGGRGAVVNASRSILFAHEGRGGDWVAAVREAAIRARDEIEEARRGT
jgi:orotidine-5'-phosphate decarboxylase